MHARTRACLIDTPLGQALARAEGEALSGFWFIGQKYYPPDSAAWLRSPDDPLFRALRSWLKNYFAGKNPAVEFAVQAPGTPFQKAVWTLLRRIPYGRLSTYGEIAGQLPGGPPKAAMSARAVGGAVGHNPVSLLIPCHRVIAANGSLCGYAGGLHKKEALLRLEGAPAPWSQPCL